MPYRDTPETSAICPRCMDAPLAAHARGHARVFACRACGGVFADRETVLRVRPNPEVRAAVEAQAEGRAGPSRDQVGTKLRPSADQVAILRKCREDQPLTALMAVAGRSNRTKFRDQVLRPLLTAGLLEPTIPDKPRSSRQRYRLTDAGREYLEKRKEKP